MHCMEDYILWFDLETTGVQEDDEIIEFGAVVTDWALQELGSYNEVYTTTRMLRDIEPHVLKMHLDNGLWAEVCSTDHLARAKPATEGILRWLGENEWMRGGHIVSAGSGVSHFDRRFLARYMPDLNRRLTYWNLDVGVMRRMLRLLCLIGAEEYFVETGNHRALDDARRAVSEAKAYRDLLIRRDDPRDFA